MRVMDQERLQREEWLYLHPYMEEYVLLRNALVIILNFFVFINLHYSIVTVFEMQILAY